MKQKFSLYAVAGLTAAILGLALAGCARQPEPVNTQATIDAAVQATKNAELAVQATIDAAVQATALAQQAQATPTATPVPTLTPTLSPTPAPADTGPAATPIPTEEYYTLSEEELAALIDQAATEAAEAAVQYSNAAAEAAADDTVTAAEVETIEVYVSAAEEAVALAEALIGVYADVYGELAVETVESLDEISAALVIIAENTEAMNLALEEVNSTLEQGAAVAQATIDRLEATAQAVQPQAEQVKQQAQNLSVVTQAQIDHRVQELLSLQPTIVADNPQAALESVVGFLQAGQQAVGDGRLSPDELQKVVQAGVNASAGLKGQGIPQLDEIAGAIDRATGQLARGDVGGFKAGLDDVTGKVNGLDIGGISKPSLPQPSGDRGKPSRRK